MIHRETKDETKARIAAIAESSSESYGFGDEAGVLRFTTYYGLVGTAANLKTHYVAVMVWEDNGAVQINSKCGTTSKWRATAHTSLRAKGDVEVTCRSCNRGSRP